MPEAPMLDVEHAVRAWLRDLPELAPTLERRVFFGMPKSPSWPLVIVSRIGGTVDTSDAPIDVPALSFACWGPDGNQSRAIAKDVAYGLRAALLGLVHGSPVGAGFASGPAVIDLGPLWLPDRDTGRARYMLDATLHLHA